MKENLNRAMGGWTTTVSIWRQRAVCAATDDYRDAVRASS